MLYLGPRKFSARRGGPSSDTHPHREGTAHKYVAVLAVLCLRPVVTNQLGHLFMDGSQAGQPERSSILTEEVRHSFISGQVAVNKTQSNPAGMTQVPNRLTTWSDPKSLGGRLWHAMARRDPLQWR